jgi:hypothetical protein
MNQNKDEKQESSVCLDWGRGRTKILAGTDWIRDNAVNLEKTAGEQTDHEGIHQEKLGAGKINVEELIRRQ